MVSDLHIGERLAQETNRRSCDGHKYMRLGPNVERHAPEHVGCYKIREKHGVFRQRRRVELRETSKAVSRHDVKVVSGLVKREVPAQFGQNILNELCSGNTIDEFLVGHGSSRNHRCS